MLCTCQISAKTTELCDYKFREYIDYTGICLEPGRKAFSNRKTKIILFAFVTSYLIEHQIGELHPSSALAISPLARRDDQGGDIHKEVTATERREGMACESAQPGHSQSVELSSSSGNLICHRNHFQLL